MTDPQRNHENRRLRRLSDVADRTAGDAWAIESDDRGTFVISERFNGKRVTLCKFGQAINDDEMQLISGAIDNLTFFLPLVTRAIRRIREQDDEIRALRAELDAARAKPRKPGGDYAAEASMLLVNEAFWLFLTERRGGELVEDKDAADAALKEALGIESKRQINNEDRARDEWLSLRAEFKNWKAGVAA